MSRDAHFEAILLLEELAIDRLLHLTGLKSLSGISNGADRPSA